MNDYKNFVTGLLTLDTSLYASGGEKLRELGQVVEQLISSADEEALSSFEADLRKQFTIQAFPGGGAYTYGYFHIENMISGVISRRRYELISFSSPELCYCHRRAQSGTMSPEGLKLERKEEDYDCELHYYRCQSCGQTWVDEVGGYTWVEHRWRLIGEDMS